MKYFRLTGDSKIAKGASRSHGVMVSTLDSESSDPSSNLGGTFFFFTFSFCILNKIYNIFQRLLKKSLKVSIYFRYNNRNFSKKL